MNKPVFSITKDTKEPNLLIIRYNNEEFGIEITPRNELDYVREIKGALNRMVKQIVQDNYDDYIAKEIAKPAKKINSILPEINW